MHHHQLVHQPGGQRPQGFFTKHADIGHPGRPWHHALRPRHQPDHPPRLRQVRAQQRHGKAESRDCLCLGFGPQTRKLITDDLLRRTTQLAAVIEVAQILHVQMHCGRGSFEPSLHPTIPSESDNAMPLEIVIIPCLTDNYAYLLHDAGTGQTALVDAPEVGPIRAELDARGWRLTDILITHHHGDHIDGVTGLRSGARVIGAAADAHRLPPLDVAVKAGDSITVCDEVAQVIDVPGHTLGHVAFHFAESQAVFTADSLMALGCGRLFEGSPAQMWDSLTRLAALPGETRVYSGHEYTATNARFALTIDPDNSDLVARVAAVTEARAQGRPTVPATIALECATNPFMRANLRYIRERLGLTDAADAAVFAEIRARKDRF